MQRTLMALRERAIYELLAGGGPVILGVIIFDAVFWMAIGAALYASLR